MIPLNEINPNDLFRFVNVRGPQKQKVSTPQYLFTALVYDYAPAAKLAQIAQTHTLLYPSLNALNGKSDQLAQSQKLVSSYKKSKDYLVSPDDYPTTYSKLTALIDWLDVNADYANATAVEDKFKSIFGVSTADYIKTDEFLEAKVLIWDNLFANLFSAGNAFLITLGCKYLGTLNLVDVTGQGAPDGEKDHPGRIYRSKPLVPKWFFNLSAQLAINPEEGVGDQVPVTDQTKEQLIAKYQRTVAAINDLKFLFERKRKAGLDKQELENPKVDVLKGMSDKNSGYPTRDSNYLATRIYKNVPDPGLIVAEDLKTLKGETVAAMEELLGKATSYDYAQLLGLLNDQASGLAGKAGEQSQVRAIKVGNSIIYSDDFCADMIDKDPCGRGPRKDFLARGSFVTSSLIGDLLVTKQQLIKYSPGEVAHVETAMVGLDKERTHRRLNRTEESTLIETETTTENERETQTTDRFDMEKESSKVLQQDFQIDSGINVSGNYGTVQFNSTLDASYGYSSLQSQSDATSFSKSVTNRALSRVKERVRTVKTLTVINELEETTVNKLINNTGDNVNGVYRWLDKYYLNKIINYGKRLMFEFTIPEPAAFYIFRQMVKPKTNNDVIKPSDPRTTTDPSGHTLNSPTDINETNYTFWAALYETQGIDAPPTPILRTSNAYKNGYGTSQSGDIFDSFSTDIQIEKDYEAYFAQAQIDNYWWGASNINATIGTTPFGGGYTTINLPYISNTLGLSLLSRGMNWQMNVIITMARSAKLYAQWQNATYSKIIDAYNVKLRQYQSWLDEQNSGGGLFTIEGNNPGINREIEREELKKRCVELFTGQRFESFDAAVNGIYNVSAYPEILFAESIREGNVVKFFEQAFDWANMTYIFYPYMWGRKDNWLSMKKVEDPSDPLFTKFLQAGYSRVVVPIRPDFENYAMMFHMLAEFISAFGCSWNFQPSIFGSLGISNTFNPAINDPTYISIATEIQTAAGYTDETGPIYGTPYVQKLPTNLVYIIPNSLPPTGPFPGLPDNSADPDIAPYL